MNALGHISAHFHSFFRFKFALKTFGFANLHNLLPEFGDALVRCIVRVDAEERPLEWG